MENKLTKRKELGQFYTNPLIAEECVINLKKVLNKLEIRRPVVIEPSAGTGNFLIPIKEWLYPKKIHAFDLDPKHKAVKKADWFEVAIPFNDNNVVVGNPPFGNRASLAVEFVNKAFDHTNIVAMILPIQFRKYGTQRKIYPTAKLIVDQKLPLHSFIVDDKPYPVQCVFQIWTTDERLMDTYENLRVMSAPATNHPDFEMFLYNNTEGARKFFNKKKYGWEFALPRQGYYDYNERTYLEKDLLKNRQYMFFKPLNENGERLLNAIDFDKLAKGMQTTTPGFGKADVVAEANKLCK